MHSTIEGKTRRIPIYSPDEWVGSIRTARSKPKPYNVVQTSHQDIIDFKPIKLTIKDHTKKETIKWRKVRQFIYANNTVKFAYNLDSDSFFEHKINVRGRRAQTLPALQKAYRARLPIMPAKKKDLLELCKELVIPLANHAFYHALPTKSAAGGAEEHEEDCECDECDDDDE